MSLSPLTFTGVSSLSGELQTVLTRAVSIASLPLKRLQNTDTDTLQKKTLLGAMTGPLSSLGSTVATLGDIASKNAVAAVSSNPAKVAVTNTGATAPALYSITEITSLAQAASETTTLPLASDAKVSANGSMRLIVGSAKYDFSLTTNNLGALSDKINSLGAGVSASVLTTSQGNYLSISTNTTGKTTLQLVDDPSGTATNLLTSNNQGSNASFKLNGIAISRASNIVNDVVGGVTFTLLDKTAANETVNLTLATDRTQLSAAIQDFATKYNAVADQVNQQVGQNAGLLSGDFLVREVQKDLRALGGYQTSGTIKSLADVGLSFSTSGKLSFDSTKFDALSDTQIAGAFQFFGSSTTGFGALAKKFTELTDPITGLIKTQQDSYDSADRRLQQEISDMTDRITAMQKSVSARLQLADTLLASLESQQKTITASIQGLNYSLYGKQQGS